MVTAFLRVDAPAVSKYALQACFTKFDSDGSGGRIAARGVMRESSEADLLFVVVMCLCRER